MNSRLNKIYVLLLVIFLPLSVCLAQKSKFSLAIEHRTGLGGDALSRLTKIINQTETTLPSLIKKTINTKVNIEYRPLNKSNQLSILSKDLINNAPDRYIFATIKKSKFFWKSSNTILLDDSLLMSLVNIGKVPTKDREYLYEFLQRLIIHEVGHIFDNLAILINDDKGIFDTCSKISSEDLKKDYQCRSVLNSTRSVSNSPYFLNLAGWHKRGLILKNDIMLNKKFSRSPDRYEYKNPEEFFAVNLEYFLLDPEYKCRRPTLYNYYTKIFNHIPLFNKISSNHDKCKVSNEISLDLNSWNGSKASSIKLDLSRLYQIHYLFASKGEPMMSRWGHAMYRLVFCAPERSVVNEKCMLDISHHVVISFRGDIPTLDINYIDGMVGKYDSRLYFMSMTDVIKEYTKFEFRDLISLPLDQNVVNRKTFIDKSLEMYWGYLGSYYFFTNNCATESLNMLKVSLPNELKFQKSTIVTPLGLYKIFQEFKIMDDSVLEDRADAIKRGFIIPAFNSKLKNAYNYISKKFDLGKVKNFKKYISELSADERLSLVNKSVLNPKIKGRRKSLASLLVLEDFIVEVSNIQFLREIHLLLNKNKEAKSDMSKLFGLILRLKNLQNVILPEHNVKDGYGIPLKSEKIPLTDGKYTKFNNEMNEITNELKSISETHFSNNIKEINKSLANKITIINELMKTYLTH